jgi:hypothetical protein
MIKGKVIGPADAFQSEQVLRFAAETAQATEDKPLVLGNVEFWIGTGPWRGVLTYSIPSYAWDKESVKAALVSFVAGKENELASYLNLPSQVVGL